VLAITSGTSAPPDATAGRHRLTLASMRPWALPLCLGLVAACGRGSPLPPGGRLATGTWGGDNAGLIVNDTIAHAHVGCTYGNFAAPVALDADGRFNVPGSYVLRAYPIQVGPSLPAQFAGLVTGKRLTFTVAVNDTVEKRLVALGPVTVVLGEEPRLGPCPICRVPKALPGSAPVLGPVSASAASR